MAILVRGGTVTPFALGLPHSADRALLVPARANTVGELVDFRSSRNERSSR